MEQKMNVIVLANSRRGNLAACNPYKEKESSSFFFPLSKKVEEKSRRAGPLFCIFTSSCCRRLLAHFSQIRTEVAKAQYSMSEWIQVGERGQAR